MKKGIGFLFLGAVLASFCSCQENYFDKEDYQRIIKIVIPIDSISKNTTWATVASKQANICIDWHEGETYTIRIMDSDPSTASAANVYAAVAASNKKACAFQFTCPIAQNDVYVAIYDHRGNMTYAKKSTASDTIKVNADIANGKSETSEPIARRAPIEKEFGIRYCFEDDFPTPGDFDFNDLVLTLYPKIGEQDPKVATIRVNIDAVGTTKQLAAALRISGLPASDVDSVIASRKNNFDFDYKYMRSYINSTEVKLPDEMNKTKNKDLVINLFNDAHYAISGGVMSTTGSVARYYYNTRTFADPSGRIVASMPVTYTIYCKTEEAARRITAATLDPFIIVDYNGTYLEVHTFSYKLETALYKYDDDFYEAYDDMFSWCVQVPNTFRYPLEGNIIGKYKGNRIEGTYKTFEHSFGEWLRGKATAKDWYDYPSTNMIY